MDDRLLRKQSRHDPSRWRVGDRRNDPAADGVGAEVVVTRIERDGNEEQVYGVHAGPAAG